MDPIKKFFRELKRVRWPDGKTTQSAFWRVILFVAIGSLFLFGLTWLFTVIWTAGGVGI